MGLVVEDGTGVADANAYGETSDAQAYYTDMGYTDVPSDAKLIRGARTLDSMYRNRLKGLKAFSDQTMIWPRTGVDDEDGNAISEDSVPLLYVQASFEMARIVPADQSFSGVNFIKKVKAGSVEVEFADQLVARQVMSLVEEYVGPFISSRDLVRA